MDKSQAWADFWRSGSLTSFGDKFAKGYEGELREHWLGVFRELPANAVVVDFGAGNGALEEIAHAFSRAEKNPLVMHAFDLAPSLPARFESRDDADGWKLHWHAGARNEETGLDAESVDLVIGNYAFEYGDDEASVAETMRILKPGGKACFLMHHADSNIITGAQVEMAVLDKVLGKGGFLSAVRDYINEFGNIRHPKQFEKFRKSGKGEPFRHRMNEAHQVAVKECTTENAVKLMTDISQWMSQLLQPPGFFEEKRELLHRWREVKQFLEANLERLRDMQAAGVDAVRRDAYIEAFERHGGKAEAVLFHVQEEEIPIGWMFTIRKAG